MIKLLILPLLILSFSSYANMDFYMSGHISDEFSTEVDNLAECDNQTNKDSITKIIDINIRKHFKDLIPALEEKRIKIREFENDQYYLKTFFKLGHILKDKRTYYIDLNKKLYNCSPSAKALEAILAHEIQHILDYKDMNSLQLIKLGIKMVRKRTRSSYERSTDFSVMQMGYSQGIKEYRQWIYKKLDHKALNKKKCFYYTPEEINRFMQGELDFSDYFNKYCKSKSQD
jgi:hypothetical protein